MTPTDPPPPKASVGHHHDDHLYDDEFVHNEDVAHEHTDVDVRMLLIYTGVLTLTCVVCAVIVLGLFNWFEALAAANDPVVSPLAAPAGQEPPEPRLLLDEPAALKKHRDFEAQTLGDYGWIDQKGGIARLPIAEAKKKLLHDGVAARPDGADAWMGTSAAANGESSGGRGIPGGRQKADITILKPETGAKPPPRGTKPGEQRKPH